MRTNEETFTHQLRFKNLGYNIEFLRDNGQVWCKTGPTQATKVNAPGSGNIITLDENTIVWCDPLDAPVKMNLKPGDKVLYFMPPQDSDVSQIFNGEVIEVLKRSVTCRFDATQRWPYFLESRFMNFDIINGRSRSGAQFGFILPLDTLKMAIDES